MTDNVVPDSIAILNKELSLLASEETVSVLCTCSYYIAEYNPGLINLK